MKIAFLNLYGGTVQRGAESFTQSLAEKLKENHEVIWFKGFSKATPQHQFSGHLFRRLHKRMFLDKANRSVLLFTLKKLPNILRKKFDLIIPMNGFWQLLLLKVLQPFGKFKLLVIGHSGPGWDERFNLYLKPDAFIATTKPAQIWAKRTCAWTSIELIPYAINVRKFKKTKPTTLDLPRPLILCPAALVPYKRVDLAIKAVSRLKRGSLVVLGRGGLEPELHKLGNRLIKNRFMLTTVSHSKIASYYKACDVVTLPSSPQENSPMIFLEALASIRIVVTTDTPRNRWMLERTGVFCDPTNVASYTQALKKAIQIKSEEKIIRAIDKVLEKFRWENVLPAYEKILESLTVNH